MTDPDHLEDVMTATNADLSRQLVKAYREFVRSPDVASKEYAMRLREIIEESISKRPDDASPGIVGK